VHRIPFTLTALLTALPLAQAQALAPASSGPAWGSVWSVFEGVWPLPHVMSGGQTTTDCINTPTQAPAAVFSVSALGNMQASGQPLVFAGGGTKMNYGNMIPGSVSTYGSTLSVPAGTAVRVDWACFNSTACQYGSFCSSHNLWGNCNGATGTLYGTFYKSSSGGNFSTGGALYGATTVYPTITTTYALSCGGTPGGIGWTAVQGTSLSLTVYVTPACGPAIEAAPGNGSGWILYNGVTRQFNGGGYSKCLTNNSGYSVFIPGRTQAEITSFFAHPPAGVTIK
jgi:hypothetical protein